MTFDTKIQGPKSFVPTNLRGEGTANLYESITQHQNQIRCMRNILRYNSDHYLISDHRRSYDQHLGHHYIAKDVASTTYLFRIKQIRCKQNSLKEREKNVYFFQTYFIKQLKKYF